MDHQPQPSFNPSAPKYDTQDVKHVDVTYDDGLGTVVVGIQFWDPQTGSLAGGSLSYLNTNLSPCSGGGTGAFQLRWEYDKSFSAVASVSGVSGTLAGTLSKSADGTTFTLSFQHDLLRGRDWRCIDFLGTDGPFNPQDPAGYGRFYFAGYEPAKPAPPVSAPVQAASGPTATAPTPPPVRLTAANAQAAVIADLKRRFGANIGAKPFVTCPSGAIVEGTAYCQYYLLSGRMARDGAYQVDEDVSGPLLLEAVESRVYSTKRVRCGAQRLPRAAAYVDRVRIVERRAAAPAGHCDRQQLGDIEDIAHRRFPEGAHKFITAVHGTGTGFYRPITVYHCNARSKMRSGRRRYSVRCVNGVGDTYTYAFVVYRKPKPKPRPRPKPAAPSEPSGGSGQYAGLNCSQIGHSFPVTPGSDPEHDRDNDGVACEAYA